MNNYKINNRTNEVAGFIKAAARATELHDEAERLAEIVLIDGNGDDKLEKRLFEIYDSLNDLYAPRPASVAPHTKKSDGEARFLS